MSTQDAYEEYYVPHNSKLPIFASLGIFLTLYGMGNMFNEMSAGVDSSFGEIVFLLGGLVMGTTLFFWFAQVIKENHEKLYSNQLNRSFVWGMSWFIFSEVMFFAAFFGALFYVRMFVVGWLGGEGERGPSDMLWPEYTPEWPLMNTPDPERFPGPQAIISPWGLPLVNTILLVTSSVTITIAHHGLNDGNRKKLINWLVATIALGVVFLFVQAYEYYHAYNDLGLTLGSGIFGTTFFMLTGFHGAHVTLGTFMLIIMLFRAIKGHFSKEDCFGFEAAAWYWHFVDVVWLGLFVFVYVLGS
ncbi:MAG: cytochrome c oxidase subunit 3 [Pseudomonadales bacterium]|nr:cytochrome c oxidase subunit 3 [Pseudomonadales bacterium]MBO6596583.1 cytochrome c oxidase subunit 3 [Pseudomonadales bacterium]MBO6656473.1 cytochrome c oxidase subunit 3 [Pseudomonadales bacterium]MBO6703278.1 cytochrome c oxidase subunit 3 [Pseudomonadales bacterium]MBO6823428.1 cytochrome c oxidase subunit 3 [Pseudomonadales bacterium]